MLDHFTQPKGCSLAGAHASSPSPRKRVRRIVMRYVVMPVQDAEAAILLMQRGVLVVAGAAASSMRVLAGSAALRVLVLPPAPTSHPHPHPHAHPHAHAHSLLGAVVEVLGHDRCGAAQGCGRLRHVAAAVVHASWRASMHACVCAMPEVDAIVLPAACTTHSAML